MTSGRAAEVSSRTDLEAVVGAPPAAIMLKSIRFLDEHCRRFLARSPFAVVGTTTADGGLQAIASGGEPGHLTPRSDTVLDLASVPLAAVPDSAPIGLLSLVPGYGESLRINGRLHRRDGVASMEVEEAFLHCAKAIMRSELWTAPASPGPDDDPSEATVASFLAEAPFVVLVSTDATGHADASPKGDPPGLIRQIDDTTIAIADRPGNRRTDTLHNLMDEPRVAVLALRPGSDQVVEVRGTARVSTDVGLLASMRLRGRTPKVAVVVDVDHQELRHEPTLAVAGLWDASRRIVEGDLPRAATIWADHVRRNTDAGTGAKVARRLVSRTALAAGVALDYRTNL